jgi:DNA-binding NtrC family response regulator
MLRNIESETKPIPLTVIVADKHPIARAALASLLTYDGYRVFQADSLDAAVSCIDYNENLSVLIADLEMPEWRSIVRYAVRTTHALVMGMEGNHPISEMYDLHEHGLWLCLQKPINYNDVRGAIEKNVLHPRTAKREYARGFGSAVMH